MGGPWGIERRSGCSGRRIEAEPVGINQGVPHPFDWLSNYIYDRGLQRRWPWVTAAYTAVLASLPLVMLASPNGPDRPLTRLIAACIGIGGLLAALMWLVRWPSERQSSWFLLGASATTALGCVTLSNPYSALMGCAVFAVLGGFIAYFHPLRYVLINFAVCTVCAAGFAARLIKDTGDIALAAAALMTVAALNIGVPFGIRSLVHTLRTDLRASDFDPLTGLLNRRAFHHALRTVVDRRTPGTHLVILMIDLDHFKQLNDTWGHALGDQALVAVSAALQANCHPASVIGRIGGEEFIVADIDRTGNPVKLAERIRAAIDAIPFSTTASIGTASMPLGGATSPAQRLLTSLIHAADSAMYKAKRAGGNQVCHHSDLQNPATDPQVC